MAHWLVESFKGIDVMLHSQSLPGSHTGELPASKYEMLKA